ncbi:MAG: MFS transporter [Rhodospirillales bacterium]|nr:MFS transporter [Rhodospirillales bacterium]
MSAAPPAPRLHYAWVALGVSFLVVLSVVGVRAAPSVLIVPLQQQFGWSRAMISAAVSLNILLFGLFGPFVAALFQTLGLRRTLLGALSVLVVTMGLTGLITAPWQLFATWGLLVGTACSACSVGLAAAIANRWFVTRRGFAVGLLTAGNASGQLVFLPVLAAIAQHGHWQYVPWLLGIVLAAMIPVVWFLLPENPRAIGLAPLGGTMEEAGPRASGNPVTLALDSFRHASRSLDFWLLFGSFAICGFSTNGLIGTHFIPYCVDHGISEVTAASVVASLGVFDLFGTTLSGWLTDRFNPRKLLFWYYGLRGLSLVVLPFTAFDPLSLSIFAVFYGLDWVATVPPTVLLTTTVFGRKEAPVVVSWIVAGHQIGASIAALGAGVVRTETGSYADAFIASGLACMIAALIVLRIARGRLVALA